MIIKEVKAKSILSASKVHEWVINPYTGCQHGCSYCYARFMKKFTGHKEPWGQFVDVKVNAAELLEKEVQKKKRGWVWVSGVCDPYQPLEEQYGLTRKCLQALSRNDWPAVIQTRSPLVLRDMDILKGMQNLEAGLSITTVDDEVRKIFEPGAPPIVERVKALGEMQKAGIKTYAMVAPMLPGAEGLVELLKGKIDYLLVDRMNYHYADWVYRKYGLQDKLTEGYFRQTEKKLGELLIEGGST